MIYLENVSMVFRGPDGPVPALSDVSMEVRSGEFVAVRGPSGSGKSTLLTVVGSLATPTAGRVTVGGDDLTQMSAGARAHFRGRKVGFVFQMFHLLPYLNVLDNVAAAALPGQEAAARQYGRELLDRFRLAHRLGHRPAELSAGERQRVAIARALVNHPDLILADEPTGNLDTETAGEVLDLLTDFHRRGGTLLLVTHQEQAAARAERTVSILDGKLVDG